MDEFGLKTLLFLFGVTVFTGVGMLVDSAITNHIRYKTIDRVLTTMETAMKEGLLTPAEFKECVDDLSNKLKEKAE